MSVSLDDEDVGDESDFDDDGFVGEDAGGRAAAADGLPPTAEESVVLQSNLRRPIACTTST